VPDLRRLRNGRSLHYCLCNDSCRGARPGGPIREEPAAQDSAGAIGPSAAEVRAALERILASRCFEQAGRSSSFLRFVVEQTLAGQGERLKGYTVAVEVFGRPPDFDAQSDPLVRVEAGRLRRRLIEYYADEGRDDPVRIDLPRGSYSIVSAFSSARSQDAPVASESSAAPARSERPAASDAAENRRRWRRIRSVVVAAVMLAGAAVIVFQRREAAPPLHDDVAPISLGLAGSPPIVVLPFEVLGGSAPATELAATLTEEIFLVLGGSDALLVPAVPSGTAAPVPTGYVLSGSVREMEGQVRVTARVVLADTGAQVWSAAYDEPLTALRSAAGQRRIARLVAMVADPYGPIFDVETGRMHSGSAHEPVTRDCVLRYYEYRRAFGAAEHAAAMDCFDLAAKRDPGSVEAWAGLSLLAADAWAHGFAGQAGRATVLERAREAARRAMDIDGENLHANLALAAVQYFSGADFSEVARRILETWPENAEAQGYLGAMFVLSGDTQRGDALVAEAMAWTPKVPSGYYASRALAALREQRYDDALALALRIDAPDWTMGHYIVAAAGALGGRGDLAARAHASLVQQGSATESSLADALRRWRVEPPLADEVERGFAAAAAR
jgi:adenylate cyclase